MLKLRTNHISNYFYTCSTRILAATDYLKTLWNVFLNGQNLVLERGRMGETPHDKKYNEKLSSILFFSKALRFCAVGGTGLLVNFVVSYSLSNGVLSDLWYMAASLTGIIVSMTSNFFLNKVWTFEDRDFSCKRLLKQYGMFVLLCSFGALLQILTLYLLVDVTHVRYDLSLTLAALIGSASNFIFNKKWTFKEKIWG
jgi:dolichol-phosphate mannosyltransferase